ncbi:MAG: 30S ribosomal protein S20 [Nitrospirae bacterium]|nr:30S ribosomal protein S20 [Nitrospirota bacterium]
MPAKPQPKRSKSVLKRIRQTGKRTLRNKSAKSMLKTFSKKVEDGVLNKNIDEAKSALQKAISAIDSAKTKGIIHRNTAARKVSRLTRLVNPLLSAV